MAASAAVGSPAPAPVVSWRKRHPTVARLALYGTLAAIGATAWLLLSKRAAEDEQSRQVALMTRISGAELVRVLDPDRSLKILREEVLAASPNDDTRRSARLAEAATLDSMKRFEESEAAYARLAAEWPAATPRGALTLPWANMRVRAGQPKQALVLLDAPHALDGETEADVRGVRDAAARSIEKAASVTDGSSSR